VVADGSVADEELLPDRTVRESLGGEPRDFWDSRTVKSVGTPATLGRFWTVSPVAASSRVARISSKSQHQIAEDLGISDVTLRNWVKQAERDEGKRPDGLSTDEREELARLRRENQTLRMEREILKKAAAFFARETGEP
jgi:transposase